jgi:hypothetical protein
LGAQRESRHARYDHTFRTNEAEQLTRQIKNEGQAAVVYQRLRDRLFREYHQWNNALMRRENAAIDAQP